MESQHYVVVESRKIAIDVYTRICVADLYVLIETPYWCDGFKYYIDKFNLVYDHRKRIEEAKKRNEVFEIVSYALVCDSRYADGSLIYKPDDYVKRLIWGEKTREKNLE